MQASEWIDEANKVVAQLLGESSTSTAILRNYLAKLDHLLRMDLAYLVNAYEGVSDESLTRSTELIRNELNGDSEAFEVDSNDLSEIVLMVGGCIHALDQMLHEDPEFIHLGSDDLSNLKCQDPKCFVIPRPYRNMEASSNTPVARRYSRRGPPNHAIIYAEVDGHNVNVASLRRKYHNEGSQNYNDSYALHGVLFQDYTLETSNHSPATVSNLDSAFKYFQAVRCDCAGIEDQIKNAVEKANDDGAIGLVFPELTMPEELQGLLQETIRIAGNSGSDQPVQWVYTGSWHFANMDSDGYLQNRGRVINGFGEDVCHVSKFVCFEDHKVGREPLSPEDNNVQLLVTDHFIIAFGICKDFCDRGQTIFERLPVDLVVVSSMGDDGTMSAHSDAIRSLKTNSGTHTFIVQQDDVVVHEGEPLAYVNADDEYNGYIFPSVENAPESEERGADFRHLRSRSGETVHF